MQNLTEQAHEICRTVLKPGDIAIDATAGNGHDTLFLAQQVGSTGSVFAFDLQAAAIAKTAHRLEQAEVQNVRLFEVDHSRLLHSIPEEHHGQVAAVMFNLGYLPGGDKTVITDSVSTITAVEQSLELLRPGGLLTVLAYTGHPGGKAEADAVGRLMDNLCNDQYAVNLITADEERISPPQLFVVKKK